MKLFATLLLFVSTSAFAATNDIWLSAGLRNTSFTPDGGATAKTVMDMQVGGLYMHPFNDQLSLRTGGLYTPRTLKSEATVLGTTVTGESKLTYIDIPATANYVINDTWTVYGGLILGMKMSDSCSTTSGSCTNTDVKSMVTPLTVGGTVHFGGNMGVAFAYETDSSSYVKGASNENALAVNYLYGF